jgi:hypothetical protein
MADNDTLKLLLNEMKLTNSGVASLISLRKQEDTPKSLLAGNLFEILNARMLFKEEKELIVDTFGKSTDVKDTEKAQKDLFEGLLDFLGTAGSVAGLAFQNISTLLPKLVNVNEKGFLALVNGNKKLLLPNNKGGMDISLMGKGKTGMEKSLYQNIKDLGLELIEKVFGSKKKSSSDKANDKKDAKEEKSVLENALEVATHPLKSIKEGIFGLKDGLLKKGGLAAILGVVIFGFLAFFKPAADGFAALINGTRGFFSDIGKVFRGEMGIGEFLRENFLAILGTGAILFFTRIGTVLLLVGRIIFAVFRNIFAIPFTIFKALEGAVDGFFTALDSGAGPFEILFSVIEGLILGVGKAFKILLLGVLDLFIPERFMPDVNRIVDKTMDLVFGFIEFIFSGLKAVGNFGDKVLDFLTFGYFSEDETKGMYKGGAVASGSSYLVGEKGPEMFVPGRSGYIDPMNGGMGGGTTVINNIVNQSSTSTNTSHSNFNITDSQQEITGL